MYECSSRRHSCGLRMDNSNTLVGPDLRFTRSLELKATHKVIWRVLAMVEHKRAAKALSRLLALLRTLMHVCAPGDERHKRTGEHGNVW